MKYINLKHHTRPSYEILVEMLGVYLEWLDLVPKNSRGWVNETY